MMNILRCLLRSCFGDSDTDDDTDRDEHTTRNQTPPAQQRRRRSSNRSLALSRPSGSSSRTSRSGYQVARQTEDEAEQAETQTTPPLEDDCCDAASSTASDTTEVPPSPNVLHEFWSRLRDRLAKFEVDHAANKGDTSSNEAATNGGVAGRSSSSPEGGSSSRKSKKKKHKKRLVPGEGTSKLPYLRTAITFDKTSLDNIPTIHAEEVVLPGSKLQAEMAVAAAKSFSQQDIGDECVICMDSFDPSNPRMPTLCGCGENKTFFHLPCLYQWIEQNKNCPSCRKRLRWEEF